jgi:hypothetical protein
LPAVARHPVPLLPLEALWWKVHCLKGRRRHLQKPSLVAEAKADKEVAKAKEAAKEAAEEAARELAEVLEEQVPKVLARALLPARHRMAVAFVSPGTAELSVTALAAWFTAAGSRVASLQSIP